MPAPPNQPTGRPRTAYPPRRGDPPAAGGRGAVRPRGPARTPATRPCAACAAARAQPQLPPCDLRAVSIACQHCGHEGRAQYRALTWAYDQRTRRGLPVTAPITARDNNQLHVVAAGPSYQEAIGVSAELHARADPALHPRMTVTLGQQVVSDVRGRTTNRFTLQYDTAWFTRVVAAASRPGGLLAIRQLFFPPPREYVVRIVTCGARAEGNPWGVAAFRVFVYPDDEFKLSVSLPPFRQSDRAWEGGTDDEGAFRERQRTVARNGQTQTSVTVRNQNGTTTRAVTRAAPVGPNRTVTQGGGRRDITIAQPSPSYAEAVRNNFKLERGNGDISRSFGLGRFIDSINGIREIIAQVLGYFRGLARMAPQVGWSMDFSFELFSGSFELQWNWKENPANRFAWRHIKLRAGLKLLGLTFKVSFGVRALGAVAKIEAEVGAELFLGGEVETRPNSTPDFAIVTEGTTTATVRVVAGWESTLTIEGRIETGVEATSRMRFNPHFSWTVDVKVKEGKATGTITVFGFQRSSSWKAWEDYYVTRNHALV